MQKKKGKINKGLAENQEKGSEFVKVFWLEKRIIKSFIISYRLALIQKKEAFLIASSLSFS